MKNNFRLKVLQQIDPLLQPLPAFPNTAFVWPTEMCSIGCSHCSYNSQKAGKETGSFLKDYPEEISQWLYNSGVKKIVVCGGGEPLDEPEFLIRTIGECSRLGVEFELYTSGVSVASPSSAKDYIKSWQNICFKNGNHSSLGIRLSIDAFHNERIGLKPIVDWINQLIILSPDWKISIRCLRVEGDNTIYYLSELLNAKVTKENPSKGWLEMPDGKRIPIIWKGFIFEGRGQFEQLNRLGLTIPQEDILIVGDYLNDWKQKMELGRPLSQQLYYAISKRIINLEIRSNCNVHILNSQAQDLRLNFLKYSWPDIKEVYYRDPLLHTISDFGLMGIASLIEQAKENLEYKFHCTPFSLEKIENKEVLSWITAKAICTNSEQFVYNKKTKNCAIDYLLSVGKNKT